MSVQSLNVFSKKTADPLPARKHWENQLKSSTLYWRTEIRSMTSTEAKELRGQDLDLARVLLVADEPATRLTLQAVLQAGGYFVDSASSVAEAAGMMDSQQYALVQKNPEASLEVLAHARLLEYQPATALLTTHFPQSPVGPLRPTLVEPQDLPGLLTQVADLISQRAARLVHGEMNPASAL